MDDHQLVYDYIHQVARDKSGDEVSDFVYKLFVDITAPPKVAAAMRRIVNHADFKEFSGLLFINRCIYTAINPLQLDATRHDDLKRLVNRLAQAPSHAENLATKKLRRALHRYLAHDMYKAVMRQARLVAPLPLGSEEKLSHLFPYYSFLYIPGAVTGDIRRDEPEDFEDIKDPKDPNKSSRFSLTQGVRCRRKERIYQTRRELMVYWERRRHGSVQPAVNPTRLTNEELDRGIKLYHTRRSNSFKDRADAFSRQICPEYTMSQYRGAFMDYITHPLEVLPQHHQSHLMERFTHSLTIMEADRDVTKTTIIQGFKKILDEVMFSGSKDFQALKRYVREIQPCKYAAILLNLVLGCPMIIYKLEDRLTDLYLHYENMSIESLSWLVKFFEYMHLALVMNFRYYDNKGRKDIPNSVLWIN